MKFTIFTPTYNRAHTLKRLYESLKRQTFKDFEWLVVDDGSTDNTGDLIGSFIAEKPFFPINYIKTENGGKHRAINRGLPYAKGELTFFLDSDDWLLDDALEILDREEKKIDRKKDKICAIEGWRIHSDGKMIGFTFNGDYVDASYLERGKFNIIGDKAEVYYTDIIKKYPFPEFEGEKFAAESLVWNEVAHDGYKIRWINQPIQYCDYLDDGLTHGGYAMYAKNPKQWGLAIIKSFNYGAMTRSVFSIRIYTYYLYVKNDLKLKEIARNLHISMSRLFINIVYQWVLDVFRFVLHKGKTIRKTIIK